MARISRDKMVEQMGVFPSQKAPVKQAEPDHSALDIANAALRTNNAVTQFFFGELEDTTKSNPDFSGPAAVKDTEWEDRSDLFIFSDSPEEVEEIKRRHTEEAAQNQILQESGTVGQIAALSAGVFDPSLFIPGVAGLKAATLAGRTAKGIASGAALGAGAVGIQQSVIAASRLDRDAEDVVDEMIAGAVFGGVIGGAAGLMTGASRKVSNEVVNKVLKDEQVTVHLNEDGTPFKRSIGAAEAIGDTKAEGIADINETIAANISSVIPGLRSPIMRGLVDSKSAIVKGLTNGLFEHNIRIGKNKEGIASDTAVETLMKLDANDREAMNIDVKDLYLKYAGVDEGAFSDIRAAVVAHKQPDILNYRQFTDRVSKANMNNDMDVIPEVAAAAKRQRKNMTEIAEGMQERGMLDTLEVKTAPSYFTRRWNKEYVTQHRGVLTKKLTKYFTDEAEKAGKEIDANDIGLSVEETIDNILGISDDAVNMSNFMDSMKAGTKFTKERKLLIEDKEIVDFLVTDDVSVVNNYLSQGSAAIRLHDWLQSKGLDSVTDLKKELRDEYVQQLKDIGAPKDVPTNITPEDLDILIEKAAENADPKLFKKATKRYEANKKLMDDQLAIVTGRFARESNGKLDSSLRTLRKYQTVRLLGGMTISALPDMAMPIFKHGLGATIKYGYMPMVRSLASSKLAKDDLKHIAVGVELESGATIQMLTDPQFNSSRTRSSFERYSDVATDAFVTATGMKHWNNFHKRLAGQISSARTIDSLLKFKKTGKLSERDTLRLAQMGIDKSHFDRLLKMIDENVVKQDGSFISNINNWKDSEIQELFAAATLKDVDSTIITPGKGDIPAIAQGSELARTIFQFKSFTSSATNKILLSGLQRRDKDALAGVVGLVGLGMASHAIKRKLKDKEVDTSIDNLLKEGFARSGTLGLMGDAALGLNPWFNSSRFAGLNAQSFVFGPSANLIGDAFGTTAAAATDITGEGALSESTKKKMSRLYPVQNLFYLRYLMDQVNK